MLLGVACAAPETAGTEGSSSTGVSDGGSSAGEASSSSAAPTEASASSSSGSGTSGDMAESSSGSTAAVTTGDDEAACGDGVVEGGEACEDGNRVDTDHCTNMCQFAVCGDGIKGPGEGCDDGNAVDDDQCTNTCISVLCGDGVIQEPEDCDEGIETDDCNFNCTESVCGDGIPNKKAGEACDAGGESPTCDDDCTLAECGDGKVNATAGEPCDDGGESAVCDDDCTAALCGDGKANAAAGEGCDEAGETAACNGDCSAAKCGDGQVNAAAGEVCDAGGESAACDGDCSPAACGDGVQNAKAGEGCDDGNVLPGDECSPLCAATPISLALGLSHGCALYADKSVHCWGYNVSGQLGQGNTMTLGDQPGELPTAPVAVGGKVVQLSNGDVHTCARLDDGRARCWGYNAYGQLGQGNMTNLGDQPGELPTPDIAIGAKALQIEAGGEHSCALIEGGTVRCWGNNNYGALGTGGVGGVKTKPDGKDVVGVASAVHIALGYYHGCALLADATVRCWGYNADAQLGLPDPDTKVGDPNDPVQQIAAGYSHNCAVLKSGKVRCWGLNDAGQVGASFDDTRVGDKPGEMPPPDVDLGGPAVQVVAGWRHSCALMKSGKIRCWGQAGAHGYPGVGAINTAAELPPPDVAIGGGAASISAHIGAFTCASLIDKSVRCWGSNDNGQLGIGTKDFIGDDETPGSVGPVPL